MVIAAYYAGTVSAAATQIIRGVRVCRILRSTESGLGSQSDLLRQSEGHHVITQFGINT
jgi:hypothetical protein